jgi:lipoprotein-anchoring transpeptidase ErfK/SrfK
MGSDWTRRNRGLAVGAAAATAGLLGGAAAVLVASAAGDSRAPSVTGISSSLERPLSSFPRSVRVRSLLPGKASAHGAPTALTRMPPPVVSDGARGVTVRLNGRPALNTARPTLTPATSGTWTDVGSYEFFRPRSTLEPCASYTMTVPAGTAVEHHRPLGLARTIAFTVACPGITAVQEALARLNYLPYTLHGFVGASETGRMTRAQAATRAFELPNGKLRQNVSDAPPLTLGTIDPTTTGAMQVFEGDHGLPLSTVPTQQMWVELIADETLAKRNPKPYTWVTVSKTIPETLQVHEDGKIALSSPTNTGVPGADTAPGIFPIYIRYVATTMIGTNVDGSHYNDPGVPWVNYFNGGDAVHGYIRPSYGTPQSNGCVELPIATAEKVYNMLALGDLVIVQA